MLSLYFRLKVILEDAVGKGCLLAFYGDPQLSKLELVLVLPGTNGKNPQFAIIIYTIYFPFTFGIQSRITFFYCLQLYWWWSCTCQTHTTPDPY